jgi:hypothetical protein
MQIWIAIGIGLVSLITFIIVASVSARKKRARDIREFAMANGFSFNEKIEIKDGPQVKIMLKGYGNKITNVVSKKMNGVSWTVCDYQYAISTGDGNSTIAQTIFWARTEYDWPTFILGNQNIFNRLWNYLTKKDVELGDAMFQKRYYVSGKDIEIRNLISAEAMKYLLQNQTYYTIETMNHDIIFYRPYRKIKVKDLLPELTKVQKIQSVFRQSHQAT